MIYGEWNTFQSRTASEIYILALLWLNYGSFVWMIIVKFFICESKLQTNNMRSLQLSTNADSLCMGSNNQCCIPLNLFLCKLKRIPKWVQAIKISPEEK